MAAYGGVSIFGYAVRIQHIPEPAAYQNAAFFGITGIQALWGGGRGRIFMVEGVWIETSTTAIRADETLLLSYADGIPRELDDTFGASWQNVVFTGQYRPGKLCFPQGKFALPYQAVFRGLT